MFHDTKKSFGQKKQVRFLMPSGTIKTGNCKMIICFHKYTAKRNVNIRSVLRTLQLED